MVGRRLPVVDGKLTYLERPGDYCGPVRGYTGELPAVFYMLPESCKCVHHVVSPPHTFTEEADGTLTIHASILAHPSGWHGYLEHGVWRKV